MQDEASRPSPTSPKTAAVPSLDPVQEYRDYLDSLTLLQLREIARRRNVKLSGQRKEPIVETLANALAQQKSVDEVWSSLSSQARLVLDLFYFIPISQIGFEPKLVNKTARALGLHTDEEVKQAIEELLDCGLIFLVSNGNFLKIPSRILFWLPPNEAFTAAYKDAANLKIKPSAFPLDFIQLAARLLLILQANRGKVFGQPPPESSTKKWVLPLVHGWPYDPKEIEALLLDERTVVRSWWTLNFNIPPASSPLADDSRKDLLSVMGTDADRLDFLLRLFVSLNLVHIQPGKPVEVIRDKVAALLRFEPLEQAKTLFLTYTGLQGWIDFDWAYRHHKTLELRRDANLSGGASYAKLSELFVIARHLLLWQIRCQPSGRWIDFGAWVAQARLLPINQNIWMNKSYWYLTLNGQKTDLNKSDDWRTIYTAFAEAIFTGPLSWMGMMETGYRDGRLVAFRLTDLGAAIFNQPSDFQMPAPKGIGPVLSFAADGNLILRPETAAAELVQLLTLLGEANTTPQNEITFRPTARGASRAFEAGWNAPRILAVLESAAGKPPPAPLAESFKKWQQNFGSLHFYEDLALMEFGDDYALNELLAGTSLSKYLLYRFSSRLIALRPAGVDVLREELVKKGYTPKVVM